MTERTRAIQRQRVRYYAQRVRFACAAPDRESERERATSTFRVIFDFACNQCTKTLRAATAASVRRVPRSVLRLFPAGLQSTRTRVVGASVVCECLFYWVNQINKNRSAVWW